MLRSIFAVLMFSVLGLSHEDAKAEGDAMQPLESARASNLNSTPLKLIIFEETILALILQNAKLPFLTDSSCAIYSHTKKTKR